MQPNIPESTLKETQKKVEDIRKEILDKKITFEEAVLKYSEDKETKFNQGIILNAQTNETKFDLTRMDPTLYARISNLQKDDISDPFYDETQGGEKMFKIIVMKDRTNTHVADLVDDYVKIQKLALQKKKEENITKWAKGKIEDTYIKISDKFRKCSFDKNWKKEIN
jgi:peptidyl-prolyl cis-trans isomerase SurA